MSRKYNDKWIQHAIKKPGRVQVYILNKYGEKGFNNDGTIKMEYINKGIEATRRSGNVSLERALLLAKTLKRKKRYPY